MNYKWAKGRQWIPFLLPRETSYLRNPNFINLQAQMILPMTPAVFSSKQLCLRGSELQSPC